MNRDRPATPVTAEKRKANVRLALLLAAVAVAVFVGFMVKGFVFGI